MSEEKKELKEFTIKVIWSMSADIKVSASDMNEAKNKAIDIVAEYVHEKQGENIPGIPSSRLQQDSIVCDNLHCFEGNWGEIKRIQDIWDMEDKEEQESIDDHAWEIWKSSKAHDSLGNIIQVGEHYENP